MNTIRTPLSGMLKSMCIITLAAQLFVVGCQNSQTTDDTLFQLSTIGALLVGVYDGAMPYSELQRKGDFGLGTFDALDGEMVCLDGTFYQIGMDGSAVPAAGSMTAPFAMVTTFDTDLSETFTDINGYEFLKQSLDAMLPTPNIIYAVKITGSFSYVQARSVPAQTKPYPPLSDVIESQAVFEFYDVEGTLIGFRMPGYAEGVNVSGYHFHFLTKDRLSGGHLLACDIHSAEAAVDCIHDLVLELPSYDAFYTAELAADDQSAAERIEKARTIISRYGF